MNIEHCNTGKIRLPQSLFRKRSNLLGGGRDFAEEGDGSSNSGRKIPLPPFEKGDSSNSGSTRPARGAALFTMLAVLLLLSLVALMMVYRAGVQSAQTRVAADSGMLDDALRSGMAQAQAQIVAALTEADALAAQNHGAWQVLASNAGQCVRYRVRIADTARMPVTALPWAAEMAVRTALVVARPGGWRAILDPCTAPPAQLAIACREELRWHALPEEHAETLALTIADAFDENKTARRSGRSGAHGFEGLALEAVWRGTEQVMPAQAVLRQSAFYDIDYQGNWRNITRAFTVADIAPVVDEQGRTNMRVRLSAAPAMPASRAWLAQWQIFDALWRARCAQRFVPHAWRGVAATLCLACGGDAGTLEVLDNDGEFLYFSGYPETVCAPGNFISLELCDPRSAPGVLRARQQPLTDIWFVTGVLARAACAVQVDYEQPAVARAALWLGEHAINHPATNAWLYVQPGARAGQDDAAIALQVPLTRTTGAVGLQLRQADVAAMRNCGARPLQVAGWRWVRPATGATADVIDVVGTPAWQAGPRSAAAADTLAPGALWWWTDDPVLLPDAARGVVGQVPRARAGVAATVQACTLEPSPQGGWAWRLTLAANFFDREADKLRAGVVRFDHADDHAAGQMFGVLEQAANELLVQVGLRARAEQWQPQPGTTLRMDGLCAALQHVGGTLHTPLDEPVLRFAHSAGTLDQGVWQGAKDGHWARTAAVPQPVHVSTTAAVDGVSARLALAPVRAALDGAIRPTAQARFWRALDERIRPVGVRLPLAAARAIDGNAGWHTARMSVFRAGRTSWLTRDSQASWPPDFWRGHELQFPGSDQRLRIVASAGRSFSVDEAGRATADDDARITPGFSDDAHVSSQAGADGVWEWQVPAAVTLPAQLALLSYQATPTGTPARFTVALWNDLRGAWDEQCHAVPVDASDTVAAGMLTAQHIGRGGVLRARIRVDAARAWLRGLYLVSRELTGSSGAARASRSDGFAVGIEAQVVRGAAVLAQRQMRALLVRDWDECAGARQPYVRCLRFEPAGLAR